MVSFATDWAGRTESSGRISFQMIRKEMPIEDLIREVPAAVGFLMKRGIKCIACGEPIWGTLEEAARAKGFSTEQIERLLQEVQMLKARE